MSTPLERAAAMMQRPSGEPTTVWTRALSLGVVALGSLFFLASAVRVGRAAMQEQGEHQKRRRRKQEQEQERRNRTTAADDDDKEGKRARALPSSDAAAAAAPPLPSPSAGPRGHPPSYSQVHVTYPTVPSMCFSVASSTDPRPAVLSGPLLKMIDIVASIAARRHAGVGCVTISVDAVLFLRPIYLGELIHLSAAVNRAWGTSLEIGVKLVKEDPTVLVPDPDPEDGQDEQQDGRNAARQERRYRGKRSYVAHSYLTFVAVQSTPTSFTGSGSGSGDDAAAGEARSKAPPTKHQGNFALPPVLPQTPLELRRFRLAGRRRARRIEARAATATASASSSSGTGASNAAASGINGGGGGGGGQQAMGRWSVPPSVERQIPREVLRLSAASPTTTTSEEAAGGSSAATHTHGARTASEGSIGTGVNTSTSSKRGGHASHAQRQQAALDELELEFVVQALLDREPGVVPDLQRGVVRIRFDDDDDDEGGGGGDSGDARAGRAGREAGIGAGGEENVETFERSWTDVVATAQRLGISEGALLGREDEEEEEEDHDAHAEERADDPAPYAFADSGSSSSSGGGGVGRGGGNEVRRRLLRNDSMAISPPPAPSAAAAGVVAAAVPSGPRELTAPPLSPAPSETGSSTSTSTGSGSSVSGSASSVAGGGSGGGGARRTSLPSWRRASTVSFVPGSTPLSSSSSSSGSAGTGTGSSTSTRPRSTTVTPASPSAAPSVANASPSAVSSVNPASSRAPHSSLLTLPERDEREHGSSTPRAREQPLPVKFNQSSFSLGSDQDHERRTPRPTGTRISCAETLTQSLHLVFPEHCNSNGVLFGGQLMGWMEEVALMACRLLAGGRRFSTVALDGLEFKNAVEVGE